ncbi:MAG: T9SS type A sorting domain-containing protein, partial [candidate division Zixibacteria bacterium]|nr:T9SS type A sorting domain-containing protein [candidate division Zixibacteria bacterium]
MYIINEGDLDLEYSIEVFEDRILSASNPDHNSPEPFTSYDDDYDKTSIEDDPQFPPQILDSGGPDEYGYSWIDSDDPNGPVYNWIDISQRGTQVVLNDDENQGPFPLDFGATFYGNLFEDFRICSNGFVSFTATQTEYSNFQIPSTMAPHNLLAVFWDDMNPYAGGQVYYYVNEDSAIITWENVPHYYDEGSYTFQIIILASGTVVFQYHSLVGEVNSATVGIQNSDGTIGLQVAYNQEYLHDEMAILFSQRWLRASPSSGVVPPGTTDTVTVTFDGVTLDEAVYTGSLEITGEDIYHSEDPISVPVRFVVGDPSDVIDGGSSLPTCFALYQNYPNPFNPTTEIRYDIPKDTHVKLEIYNLMGQLVSVPVDGYQKAGHKTIYWDATDQTGSKIASGIYFYRLDTDNFKKSRKMTILK